MSDKNKYKLIKHINNEALKNITPYRAYFSVDNTFPTNIIAELPLEKLQSSKIFVESKLQIEIKAAAQRNINKQSKTVVIQYFIG